MPKKIFITMCYAILIAVGALFATTLAGAEGGECPPLTGQAGPYTISLMGDAPQPDGDGFLWTYMISANYDWKIKKIRDVLLTYPDCCGEDIEIIEPDPANITDPCGSALPVRKWPMVCDDFTLKLPFTYQNKITKKISIKTNNANIGINTIGIRTFFHFYVAAIAGPACTGQVIAAENEPVSAEKIFRSFSSQDPEDVLEWKLLFDEAGNSFDAVCISNSGGPCLVETVPVNEIDFAGGILNSLPIDDPLVTGENPRCVYVRTTSGGVKKIGDCP